MPPTSTPPETPTVSVTSQERLSLAALAEIAESLADVDMKAMPQVPETAPCRRPDADPEDWHDPARKSPIPNLHERFVDKLAADLCTGCPVLAACAAWGLANPHQGGVLGGLTEAKRRALRRDQRRRRLAPLRTA